MGYMSTIMVFYLGKEKKKNEKGKNDLIECEYKIPLPEKINVAKFIAEETQESIQVILLELE